jgi:transcriptional regulator with XRE-family HTH domain
MKRMMTLQQLRDWLESHKATGRWRQVADASGVDYGTVARIARGHMHSPSVVIVERICGGIRATEPADESAPSTDRAAA